MSAQPITGGYVRSRDGTHIAYLVHGQGPTVVCLHGALQSSADWLGVARLLGHRLRFVMVDRRGHGASDLGQGGHCLADEIDDMDAVLYRVGDADMLLAHSFGAVVTLAVATSPLADRIGRLALYDPVAHGREKSRQYVTNLERLLAAGELEAGLIEGLRSLLDMSDKDLDRIRTDSATWGRMVAGTPVLLPLTRMCADEANDFGRCGGIRQQVLLLRGERTKHPSIVGGIETLSAVLPDSVTRILPGQGHSALLVAPELIAVELEAFLDAPEPVG